MVYSEILVVGELVLEWNRVKLCWGIWWEVYWISLGVVFVFLLVIFIIVLFKLSKRIMCWCKFYIIVINVLFVVLCVICVFYLLLDFYGLR